MGFSFPSFDDLFPTVRGKKNPGPDAAGPGIPFFILGCAGHGPRIREGHGPVFLEQVFRLPDQPTCRAFPSVRTVARLRLSSPVTAAGPRRNCTVFPI